MKSGSRKQDLLLNLNHKVRGVKNEENAFGSGWHRSGSKKVVRDNYGWSRKQLNYMCIFGNNYMATLRGKIL